MPTNREPGYSASTQYVLRSGWSPLGPWSLESWSVWQEHFLATSVGAATSIGVLLYPYDRDVGDQVLAARLCFAQMIRHLRSATIWRSNDWTTSATARQARVGLGHPLECSRAYWVGSYCKLLVRSRIL